MKVKMDPVCKPLIGEKVDFFYKGKIYPAVVKAHCGYDFFYIEFIDIKPCDDNHNIYDSPGWHVSMRGYGMDWDYHKKGENMQNGVSITTNDSELNIIYGMVNIRPEREQARSSVRYILTDLNDIRKNYMFLGFHLSECLQMKYYEDFGYSTMEEFCETNFGLDKTALSRCINVVEEFSKKEHYSNGIKHGAFMLELDDQWKDFSYSQLVEMLPLSEEQRNKIKPTMSIKQIREYKKYLKKKPEKKDDGKVATSQQAIKYSHTYCKGVSGAVRQQYYKKCAAVHKIIDIVDVDGRPVNDMYDVWAYILEDTGDHIVIRLCTRQDKEKPGE